MGLEKGREAAEAIGAALMLPEFAPEEDGTDFNDHASRCEADGVRTLAMAAVHQADAGARQDRVTDSARSVRGGRGAA